MTADDRADDLVRFFHALEPDARRAYDALAEADRAFGEDVAREAREHPEPFGSPPRGHGDGGGG